ncbi:MAG: hypothetical protein LIO62_03610 [Clostridiales bacterium]|nr:hypothetical protein [Clostridiales bacterium]
MLKDIGIIKRANKSSKIFDECCWEYYNNECLPSEYVELCWDAYRNCPVSGNNSLNGNIFELIMSSLLVKENIKPMYLQESVAFVPNVIYDVILYSSENYPISLSLKTSLRERYKQADLEAVALKYVHRKAECYLLSLDENEVQDVKNKISTGDILGIDNVICVTTNEFDDFIRTLKNKSFIKPEKIEIVVAKHIVE